MIWLNLSAKLWHPRVFWPREPRQKISQSNFYEKEPSCDPDLPRMEEAVEDKVRSKRSPSHEIEGDLVNDGEVIEQTSEK